MRGETETRIRERKPTRRLGRVQIRRSQIANGGNGLASLAFAAIRFVPVDVQTPIPYITDMVELVGVSDVFPEVAPGTVVPLYELEIDIHEKDHITVTVRAGNRPIASVDVSLFRYEHLWQGQLVEEEE